MFQNDVEFSAILHDQRLDQLRRSAGPRYRHRPPRVRRRPVRSAADTFRRAVELRLGAVMFRWSLRLLRHARAAS